MRTHDTGLSPEQPSVPPAAQGAPGRGVGEVAVGDVLFFPRRRCHGHVQATVATPTAKATRPDRVDVRWLDGYDIGGYTRRLRIQDLDALARRGIARVVATNVDAPFQRWGLAGQRQPDEPAVPMDPVRPGPRPPVDQLRFGREFDLATVNGFLEHPIVDHKHGGVRFQRAMFGARRPDGRLAAVAVLNVPSARQASDGATVEVVRYASHPEGHGKKPRYPNNTASWMLSRVCRWAALEGFERVRALAGTAGNDGGIYRASGFARTGTADTDPSQWAERGGGRSSWTNQSALACFERSLHETSPGVPRRAEQRLAGEDAGNAQMRMSSWDGVDPDDARVADLALTREDITDDRFDSDEYSDLTSRARRLFAGHLTADGRPLADASKNARGRLPAAVFGADVDGTLIAATAVGGDPRADPAHATVLGVVVREAAWPAHVGRWLLSHTREWADLSGYERVRAPVDGVSIDDRSTRPNEMLAGTALQATAGDGGGNATTDTFEADLSS